MHQIVLHVCCSCFYDAVRLECLVNVGQLGVDWWWMVLVVAWWMVLDAGWWVMRDGWWIIDDG